METILLILPNWVGDLVMATPALRAMRSSFPDSRITALVRPYGEGVLRGAPWFDETIAYDRRKASLAGWYGIVKALRKRRFDMVVVFPNSFSSALLARFSGAARRVGYARDKRGALLTDMLARPGEGPGEEGRFTPVYMADYYLALVAKAGATAGDRQLELFVTADEDARATELLAALGAAPDQALIGLNPGAAFGSSKCWLPDRFAEAGDALAGETGGRCIILAGPGEAEVQARIASAMQTDPLCPAPADLPLDVLKAVVRRLALMVTNDTGPRHYAHALDVPAVVLMGPTDPAYTRCEDERAVVLRRDMPCGPCHLKVCPRKHECMTSLTARDVVAAGRSLLNSG